MPPADLQKIHTPLDESLDIPFAVPVPAIPAHRWSAGKVRSVLGRREYSGEQQYRQDGKGYLHG